MILRLYPILLCFLVYSCERSSPLAPDQVVSVAKHEFLSPGDLNIQKQRFTARPGRDEVAIFRSSHRSATDPHDHLTYDQIVWTNGKETYKDVIIADRTFYVDLPEPGPKTSENIFRRSWRLDAGGYRYDINDYAFVRSSWESSKTGATGEIVYTKKTRSETEDLVFRFEMFIATLEEAKAMHPDLNIERDPGSTGWEAAYRLDEAAKPDKEP